jgi:uncharacterized protein
VAETHSGVVFFLGDRAYKAKKAVDLGFLDFRTVEDRRIACQREVALNRRLAPDVYLGVADVVGPAGGVCEHLVVMRRLPDDRRLSTLAGTDAELDDEVRDLAGIVAAFHRQMAPTTLAARVASRDAVAARWDQLIEATRRHAPASWDDDLDEIEQAADRYLWGRTTLFAERIEAGRARDGHGDLLADDIFLLDDGARILDCLDFDEELRSGDVLADIAFLAMDLERLGRPALARLLLDTYRHLTQDDWPASLADHFVAQRALVRASVGLLRAEQGDGRAEAVARRHLDLALLHLRAGTVRLVVVSGLPGTGKTTIATAVAERRGAVHLRSDDLRGGTTPAGADRYTPAAIDRVYGELLTTAAGVLARGRSVVVDATWRDPAHRRAVEGLARTTAAELVVLECQAPAGVAEARIERRRTQGTDASEATVQVARAHRATWTPWPEATVVDTATTVDEAVMVALRAVDDAGPASPPRAD